jgi:hypothetical protein
VEKALHGPQAVEVFEPKARTELVYPVLITFTEQSVLKLKYLPLLRFGTHLPIPGQDCIKQEVDFN